MLLAHELALATPLGREMRQRRVAQSETYEAGVIQFLPSVARADPRQITHADRDVLCYVLSGEGRLRSGGDETPLRPGHLCHIPANTPHDFAAATEPLSLLYCLIRTRVV